MDNVDDEDLEAFLLQDMDDGEEDIIQYNSIWDCPKITKLTNKITKRFRLAAGALMALMVLIRSHFLGGITSKQFATLPALVGRASADAETRFP